MTEATEAKRMTLANVSSGKVDQPFRIALYGVEGIGKTTFASEAPKAIFLAAENGTHHLDVNRFPQPETWADVLDAMTELFIADHDFKTLNVDSVDWLQLLAEDKVCKEHDVRTIAEIPYGKGKGFLMAELRDFLVACDALHRSRGMNILLIGHAEIKKFTDPERDDYDRYTLKATPSFAAMIREWCDGLFFANYDTSLKEKEGFGKAKAKSFGKREMHTVHSAAFDAKNRYGLPARLALNWQEFEAAIKN